MVPPGAAGGKAVAAGQGLLGGCRSAGGAGAACQQCECPLVSDLCI